jgi:hypothetical protein
MSSEASGRDPFEQIAEEFLTRYRAGERPSATEYTRRYPEFADELRNLLPALLSQEDLGAEADASGGADGSGPSRPEALPRQLGDYRLLRQIGRGGMGVVYEAEQESLGRHVAVKVLPPSALLDPRYLERFRREARAAAGLHHTSIVPVFGVGEHGGVHYYAMEFDGPAAGHHHGHAVQPDGRRLFAAMANTLHVGDLHALRRGLRGVGLDWD